MFNCQERGHQELFDSPALTLFLFPYPSVFAFAPFSLIAFSPLDAWTAWDVKLIKFADGSHQSDEDFTYFHLPPVKSRKDVASTLFGISCNRQILTKDLVVKTDDVTRSSVQKAIVVLATQVLYSYFHLTNNLQLKICTIKKRQSNDHWCNSSSCVPFSFNS